MRQRRLTAANAYAGAWLVCFVCASLGNSVAVRALAQDSPGVKIVTREVAIGKLAGNDEDLVVSPDGRRAAYPMKVDGGVAVSIDGVPAKTYDAILPHTLVFSPDSKHVGYMAESKGKRFTVLDGVEGAAYEGLPDAPPIYSPDSKRVATVGSRRNKRFVVLDGVEGPEYDGMLLESLQFSPDSKRVAYAATKKGKTVVVVDGVEGKPFDAPTCVETRTFGYYCIYTSLDGNEGIFPVLVFDPQTLKAGIGNITMFYVPLVLFSPDSRRVAYIARDKKEVFWVVDGSEQRRGLNGIVIHNRKYASNLLNEDSIERSNGRFGAHLELDRSPFSADGSRFGYIAARYETMQKKKVFTFVVLDGNEIDSPTMCVDFHFSSDGKRTAFLRTSKHQAAVIDGVEESRDGVPWEGLRFSPDSKHITYAAHTGKDFYQILDGKQGKTFSGAVMSRLLFSPDSRRTMGIIARSEGGIAALLDGVEQTWYDAVAPIGFTADSRHTVYLATRSGKQFLVVDGQEGRPYDQIIAGYQPGTAPATVCFMAISRETRELTRVECDIVETAAGSR